MLILDSIYINGKYKEYCIPKPLNILNSFRLNKYNC